jgi:cytochrome b561
MIASSRTAWGWAGHLRPDTALIVVHVGGALHHGFINHNDELRRMWFGFKAP